jgi:hypothetical protein
MRTVRGKVQGFDVRRLQAGITNLIRLAFDEV